MRTELETASQLLLGEDWKEVAEKYLHKIEEEEGRCVIMLPKKDQKVKIQKLGPNRPNQTWREGEETERKTVQVEPRGEKINEKGKIGQTKIRQKE